MNKKNFFDSFISYVSPSAALRRERSRIQLEILRKYEAASKGRRTSGWITATNASANSVIAPALHIVRDRVRDLVRNNPYAGNAVSVIEGHTIGTGIMSSLSSSLISKRYLERLSSAWLDWCESVDSNSDGLASENVATILFGTDTYEEFIKVYDKVYDPNHHTTRMNFQEIREMLSQHGVVDHILDSDIIVRHEDHVENSD